MARWCLTSGRCRPLSAALFTSLAGGSLILCPGATAATTVGSTPESAITCNANSTVVQDATAASSPSYTVPSGAGVITSWTYRAGANPGARRLKVFRPTSTSGSYAVAGESALESPAASQTSTFATRIPVQGGEVLGFFTTTGDACRSSSASGNVVRGGAGDPPVGTTFGANSLFASSTVLDVAAVVEPDADGDGYGDESQDSCPADPTVYATACVANLVLGLSTSPSSVALGDQVSYTIAVRNDGPTTAREVKVTDLPPAGSAVVSVSQGCTGFATITCKVGDLAAGASAPAYTIVIRAPDVGTLTNAASVAAITPDPDTSNNAAVAATTVLAPPFPGARIRGGAFKVKRQKAPIRITCPISARTCSGTVTLTSARSIRVNKRSKARRVPLGRAPFTVLAGSTKSISVPLSRIGSTVLTRDGNVLTSVTTTSVDAWAQAASRKATVKLLATPTSGVPR